jgi:phage terminase large subunit
VALAFWPGAAVGWGSRKEQLVDKIGDPDSIFEKMRIIVRHLPRFMLPTGFNEGDHMPFMKIVNPETGATITGEAGDNIGRGGRKLIYFKDESAHYERPEKIEAALADNTNCQIDISSVNGLGNVFHRRREAGQEWRPGADLVRNRVNVFVMDWRDHPAKDQAWYDERRAKAEADGLLHVFAQEVDRDYSASVEGVIIPAAWVTSAIDAHVKLGFDDSGGWGGALDVADEGGDLHARASRKGPVLKAVEDWGEGDVGKATRLSIERFEEDRHGQEMDVQYDSVGVGAGVKSEANRLAEEGDMPKGLAFVAWCAGAAPLDPDERVIPGDVNSPLNKDFYKNLKAQGWWELRRRFERTHKAVTEGERYDPATLISLPSELPNLQKLRKELSQATRGRTASLKMIVNKTPEGTRSPNMADAVVMVFWPLPRANSYDWNAV